MGLESIHAPIQAIGNYETGAVSQSAWVSSAVCRELLRACTSVSLTVL